MAPWIRNTRLELLSLLGFEEVLSIGIKQPAISQWTRLLEHTAQLVNDSFFLRVFLGSYDLSLLISGRERGLDTHGISPIFEGLSRMVSSYMVHQVSFLSVARVAVDALEGFHPGMDELV